MKNPPLAVAVTPEGDRNWARVAGPPSPENPPPKEPLVPATVVIVPVGETRRIRSLPASAISTLRSGASETPSTLLSAAPSAGPPSPEKPAVPLPATVVIVPVGETRRTRLLLESAIRKPPSAVTDTAFGDHSRAAVAGPPSPEKPSVPLPATVVIVPVDETLRIRLLIASAIRNPPSRVAATATGRSSLALVAGPPSPEKPSWP